MKYKLLNIFSVCVLLFFVQITQAQSISDIATVEVDNLSDAQIEKIWEKAQEQGYNLNQLTAVAKARNMPAVQIEKLKSRILSLGSKSSFNKPSNNKEVQSNTPEDIFGLTGREKGGEKEKNLLFGYDFFNNPNISFTPNINMATPSNYQVGPGDEMQIDVWGAAENSYQKTVDKQGAIQIQGVGVIRLSGLSMEMATSKIKSNLRKIYEGIGAAKNSYNKVYVSVSLSKIRTVQVNMIGELKVPGTYSLNALSTVLNALYAAGGPSKNGTFRNVEVIRKGEKIAEFDVYKYLTKGKEKGNVLLQDQDVIIVKPYQNLVTVEGEVKRPGMYELQEGETLQDLLNFCGGFTPLAYKNVIVVDRIKGAEREIKEMASVQMQNFPMKGGDKVTIREITDKYKNRVSVSGAVFHSGAYELKKGMTVLEVLNKAKVREEAFFERALLTRFYDKVDKGVIAFSITEIYDKKQNIVLQPDDEIYIYNKEELREKRFITINGAVNTPKTIDFMEGMKVEDMIAIAGGLKEGADPKNIEVSRRLKDGSFKTIGESFTLESSGNLKLKSGNPFYLEPYDIVSVRYMKGYTPQKKVVIKGEVEYPGSYSITTKNERISDLVERAGGLSPYAHLAGATLSRKKQGVEAEEQQEMLQEIKQRDTIVSNAISNKKEFRIGIDLQKILKNKHSNIDLILEEGDELIIPSKSQTVEVQGQVFTPSFVGFVEGKSLKYYVENAGGFSQDAKRSKVYVVYPNGSIKTTKSFLGIKTYPKIEAGATILVPAKKPSKNGISVQEILGITTSLATIALLVTQLTK